jgi:hypothetical protein
MSFFRKANMFKLGYIYMNGYSGLKLSLCSVKHHIYLYLSKQHTMKTNDKVSFMAGHITLNYLGGYETNALMYS